jgi:DNA-binding MarR family transcriptional regulator
LVEEEAATSLFGQVSFSNYMLYWTRLLETSYNRAFLAKSPPSTSVSIWRVLAWLSEKESLTVGELALHTHMERTVLGRLLDRMASQGLIERSADRDDRRISIARISTKGRHAFAGMQRTRDEIYGRAVSGIDAADIECTRRVIARMVMNLTANRGSHEDARPSPAVEARQVARSAARRRGA